MTDDIDIDIDIVVFLRLWASLEPDKQQVRDLHRAADEIERLRKVAYLLIDELRFNGGYEAYTSRMLFDKAYEQAVRGD